MKTLKKYAVLSAGCALLLAMVTLTNADWVLAQATKLTNVFVTNTTANPVPTAAQGTTNIAGDVGITGTPNVMAQQAGTWNVGITGMADVNVANDVGALQRGTWSVDLSGPVSLDRGVAGVPLFVQDVATVEPFQATATINLVPSATETFTASIPVPMGKRLVIEHVSASVFQNTCNCSNNYSVALDTSLNMNVSRHFLPLTSTFRVPVAFDDGVGAAGGEQTRLYADGGTNVVVIVTRNFNGFNGEARVSISGHLVLAF